MEVSPSELFGSQFSGTGQALLSSTELKEIKQMFLTGDEIKLLQSLEKVETYLSNDEYAIDLLRFDISDFICDALLPSNTVILSNAIRCLEFFLKFEEFFSQSHSCVVVESLTRCLYFLIKNSINSSSLTQCLQLLINIIKGYKNFQVNPEKKTVENIVQILDEFLKNNTLATYTKYQIGYVILGLLNLNAPLVHEEILETLFINFFCWFETIDNIFKSDHPIRQDITKLCCLLCHGVVKCLLLQNTILNKLDSNTEKQFKKDLLSKITVFIISVEAPYFDDQFPSIAEDKSSLLEHFLQTILYFFSDNLTPHKIYLAHGLGEIGFIQFATRIISYTDCDQSQTYCKLSILILLHIVLTLSEEVFLFPNVWPDGLDNFCNEIQIGFCQFPLDASQWLDTLNNPNSSFSCKLALLLYLYFYCLTAKSPDILKTIYPFIVTFINIFNFDIDCMPVLILKIVWFIYVVTQLSHTETIYPDKESSGLNKIMCVLMKQDDLSLVYTHHPAFLYWAFSFELNYNFQKKIVSLWFLNKTPDCRIIDEIIEKSNDFQHSILDILQNENGQILECAFESIKSIINKTNDDSLISNIWFSLPQTLAKYIADTTSATNIDYLIELANMKTPKNLDPTKIMRLASLLPQALTKSDLLSIVPSLTLTFNILELGLETNDIRILHVFLRSDECLKKIIKNFNTHNSEILFTCLKIITFLWKNGNKLEKLKSRKKIEISNERILNILQSNSIIIVHAGLNFLEEILLTDFQSTLFNISDANSDFAEVLFFEVQNILIRNIPELFSLCWSCLKLFLLLGTIKEFRNLELMTNPLLNEVIDFHLSQLQYSAEMKGFLEVWLDQNNIKLNDSCFDRKIFGGFIQATLRKLLKCLEENFKAEDSKLYEKLVQMII